MQTTTTVQITHFVLSRTMIAIRFAPHRGEEATARPGAVPISRLIQTDGLSLSELKPPRPSGSRPRGQIAAKLASITGEERGGGFGCFGRLLKTGCSLAPVTAERSNRVISSVPPCAEDEIPREPVLGAAAAEVQGQPPPWRTLAGEAETIVRQLEERRRAAEATRQVAVGETQESPTAREGQKVVPIQRVTIRRARVTVVAGPAWSVRGGVMIMPTIRGSALRVAPDETSPIKEAPLTEPGVVPDVFATNVIAEDHGEWIRLIYTTERDDPFTGQAVQEIVARIVLMKSDMMHTAAAIRKVFPDLKRAVRSDS